MLTVKGRVLCVALASPDLTQAEIATMLSLPFQNVNRALGTLVESGDLTKVRQGRQTFFVAGPLLRWNKDWGYLTLLAGSHYCSGTLTHGEVPDADYTDTGALSP